MFSSESRETFKNSFFIENLRWLLLLSSFSLCAFHFECSYRLKIDSSLKFFIKTSLFFFQNNLIYLLKHQRSTASDLSVSFTGFVYVCDLQFFSNFNIHILCKRKVQSKSRYSPPEVFLGKRVLKIYRKSTGEHPCQSAISIKLKSKFIEIVLRHGCSLVNLLHIFRNLFLRTTLRCYFWIKRLWPATLL